MSEYSYRASLFYSYCHKDEPCRERMQVALALLKDNGILSEWHDRKIISGTPFSPQIIKKLNSSDVVVYLVSPYFLNSEACKDEWRRVRQTAEETGQRLVPIILKPCNWMDFDNMKGYLALPRDGKPISTWDDEDEAWVDVYEQIKRVLEDVRSTFDLREKYRKEIGEIEFISQNRQDIRIDDLFVFPHLLPDNKLDFEEAEHKRIGTLDELMKIGRALVRGERLSGKTTLCKRLFLHLIDKGHPALFVDLEEAGTRKNVAKFFEETYFKQMKGDYNKWQQESELTFIFDNLTSTKIAFVEYALEHANVRNVFVATSDDDYLAYFADDERLADFTQIRLSYLRHSQQEELIRNWMGLDPVIRSGQLQLTDSRVDQLERNVNSITINNLVPRYPFFVLSILQTHEAFMPQDFEITAYGHCYHALIVAHILKLSIAKGEINSCFNFLSWLAHAIRQSSSDDNQVNEKEYEQILLDYQCKYVIKSSTINRLFDEIGPILIRKDKKVGFSWSYSYYFFLGRYLSEHYHESREMISAMVRDSYLSGNSLALIFVIHHSSHLEIIEDILQHTIKAIDGEEPVRLDLGEVKMFQELMRKLPDDIRTPRSIPAERTAERNQRDLWDSHETTDNGEAIDGEDSPHALLNDIYRALKNMEILSQILKNKHGSIEKNRLSEVTETTIDAALRIARVCLLDEARIDGFARFVEEHFEGKEDLTNLREGVKGLILFLIMGCLEKAASLISIEEIHQIVEGLRDRKATPAYDLVHFIYSINVADPFSQAHQKMLEDTLQRNRDNEVLKKILNWRVQHYFNTHELEAHALIGKNSNLRRIREPIKQSTLALLRRYL